MPRILCFVLLLVRPCLCYHVFDSRSSLIRSIIEACRNQTPNEKTQCYPILRYILDNTPSEVTARWSAGANILAFIPTIIGLMSNSINEITATADESTLLAVVLSISSITAFNSRFGDRPKRFSDALFEDQSVSPARLQTALSMLKDLMAQSQGPRSWWQTSEIRFYLSSLIAITVGVGVWYEVYEITRYGVSTLACPVKVNIGIWVGLSQLLALLNVACRYFLFNIRTIRIKAGDRRPRRRSDAPSVSTNRFVIVLRSPRNTFAGFLLQTFTAIASFTLYAYGTVVLAGTTLIPSSDVIRAMAMATISAGFGRLARYWVTSTRSIGSQKIVIDVPVDCLGEFASSLLEHAGATP